MKLNEKRIVNDIRMLSLDMIYNSKSGKPLTSISATPVIYALFAYHLKFDLERKTWCNRDRFIMSPNVDASVFYATLFYLLNEFNLETLKKYKNFDSNLDASLRYNLLNRIEMTSGASGSNIATSVGLAIGEKYLKSTFNKKKANVFDYRIYVLATIEDLMEGVSYEALSLAGSLSLDNLIILYIDSDASLEEPFNKENKTNIESLISSLNFDIINVKNGESVGDISSAIDKAKGKHKPVLIRINFNSEKYSKYESFYKMSSHMDINDLESIRNEFKVEGSFSYSIEDRNSLLNFIKEGTESYYVLWYKEYEMFNANATDNEKDNLNLVVENENIVLDLDSVIDSSKIFEEKTLRDINYQIMNVIATFIPNFMGGSANLFGTAKTYLKGKDDFYKQSFSGRNIYYGPRENLMGYIMGGLALSNIRSYGSTFLSLSDNMKSSLRLNAMMNLPVTYIYIYDSIRIGEDGMFLSPIEQIGALRSIPLISVYRPCDYKELIGSWTSILKEGKPSVLILPKNHVETIEYSNPSKVLNGAYIVSEVKTRLDLIIIATGSEVSLALKIKEELLKSYIEARVVSMPNMNLFLKQPREYQEQVLPKGYRKMVIELSNDANWFRFIDSSEDMIGVDSFSKSGSEEDIMSYFELDLQSLVIRIKNSL